MTVTSDTLFFMSNGEPMADYHHFYDFKFGDTNVGYYEIQLTKDELF